MPGLVKPSERLRYKRNPREADAVKRTDEVIMRPVAGLEELVDSLPSGITMVEIGSFSGESTEVFIRSGKIKKIVCVEPWSDIIYEPMRLLGNEVFQRFQSRIAKLKLELPELPEIVISRRLSAHTAPLLKDGEYDFIYIDGDHSYKGVKEDIINYFPKLKEDGILAGHDYYPNEFFVNDKFIEIFPDVPVCVDEMIGKPDKVFPDTSWLKTVKNIIEDPSVNSILK